MVLYKCAFTNRALFSDEFPISERYGGFVLAVKSAMVNPGSLPSPPQAHHFFNRYSGQSPGTDDWKKCKEVNNLIWKFDYETTEYAKDEFYSKLKAYLKFVTYRISAIYPNDKARLERFQKEVKEFFNVIMNNFDDFEIFDNSVKAESPISKKEEVIDVIQFSLWEHDNDKGPTFYYFKDALIKQ